MERTPPCRRRCVRQHGKLLLGADKAHDAVQYVSTAREINVTPQVMKMRTPYRGTTFTASTFAASLVPL